MQTRYKKLFFVDKYLNWSLFQKLKFLCQKLVDIFEMFSALKKLAHRSPDIPSSGAATTTSPCGVNAMNVALQKKFARGVNYNLKLILKGDRNTGKSCLLRRLQVSFHYSLLGLDPTWFLTVVKCQDLLLQSRCWHIFCR